MSKKIAVVLFNLGGPDSKNAIEPFLFNFFMDKNIIRLPVPFRCLLAKRISTKRSKREAGDSYAALGNKSPLLENSRAQSLALELLLNDTSEDTEYRSFVCMRYWHPMADQVVREVRDYDPDHIVILPLYPQFSTTTTWSSLGVWNKAMHVADYQCPTSTICCYPNNDGFVKASVANIKSVYEQAQKDGHEKPRVLFSAHGLPESVIKDGDPYQWQCEQSAQTIVKALGIQDLDWQVCYQSRVGPKKWIAPSTEEALDKAAADKKSVLVYPHAFTQEHVETLVEIEEEYREYAEHKGIKGFYRVSTVSTHPEFIAGLSGLVKEHLDKTGVFGEKGVCVCPGEFRRCCMRSLS